MSEEKIEKLIDLVEINKFLIDKKDNIDKTNSNNKK